MRIWYRKYWNLRKAGVFTMGFLSLKILFYELHNILQSGQKLYLKKLFLNLLKNIEESVFE
jgi:hypothetical protein